MKIKRRITLSIAITTLIAATLVTIVSLIFSTNLLKKEVKDNLKYANESYANSCNSNFNEIKKTVDILENEVVENLVYSKIRDPKYLDNFIQYVEPIVRAQAQGSEQSKNAYIYFNPKLTNSVHDVYYADSNKDDVVSRQNQIPFEYYLAEGDNLDKSWWFVPMKTKKDYWTNPYYWKFDNGNLIQVISYVRPVFINGEFICIIGSDFMYSKIENITSKIKTYNSEYAFILNDKLDILVHPKYTNRGNLGSVENGRFKWIINDIKLNSRNLLEYVGFDGKKRYMSYVKLSNGWILGLSVEKSEILAPLYNLQYIIYAIVLIILGTFIVFSIRLAKLISNPIEDISNILKEIDYSNFSIKIPENYILRQDEIGILSKTIDTMSKKIEENFNEINKQNIVLKNEINQRQEIESTLQLTFKILSNTEDGIFICDENFKIKYLNKSFTKITGHTEFDVRTNGLSSVINLSDSILNDLKKNKKWSGEIFQVKKNGQGYPQYILINMVNHYKNYYMGIFRDLTENKLKEKNIDYLKNYDYLTKLFNKESFKNKVNEYLESDIAKKYMAAFIIVDLDNFSVINEALSFEHGNQLLIEISKQMVRNIGVNDILARTDGDEFSIFITDIKEIEELQEKIKNIINLFKKPFNIYKEDIFVGISMGISLYPTDSLDYEGLLKNSTSALSYLKLNKKKPYEFYYKQMNELTAEKYEILKNLRQALEKDEFVLYYQPQIDIEQNRIIGIEALIRWDRGNGLILPNKFIPLAEESRLILSIGEWVLRKACELGYNLFKSGIEMTIGVNISAAQFKKDYLIEVIKNTLKETSLPPRLLDIEITEGILLENKAEAAYMLSQISDLGINVSIDDFGTGYSSLAYLKSFKVDRLKIDRAFVKDIPEKDDGTIAKIIIELSKQLKIKVIAEGIETKEQIEFMEKNSCNEIQGYYFSKPLSEEDLIEFIKKFNDKGQI